MPRAKLKLRADGRYRAKADGQYFYGGTQSEAFAKRDAYLKAKADGLRSDAAGITVDAYAAKWLPIAKAGVDDDTYNDYARMLNTFACAFVGVPLAKVLPTDVSAVFVGLSGKSKSYIRKYVQLVRGMFSSAVDDGAILRSPLTKSVTIPDGTAGSHRALSPWEQQLIIRSVGHHDFAPAAMLMMFAGLRRGEMLALDVSRDVDFDLGVIHVSQAVKFYANQPTLTDPKTDAGVRDIPLFAPLRAVLQPILGLVLTGESGSHMSEIGVRKKFESYLVTLERLANGGRHKRWYGCTKEDKALIASGGTLPPWRTVRIQMHDFRHTFATLLWESGVDVKTAMKWMGHADEEMLLKIYAHLTSKRENASAIAMAKTISLIDDSSDDVCGGHVGGHSSMLSR